MSLMVTRLMPRTPHFKQLAGQAQRLTFAFDSLGAIGGGDENVPDFLRQPRGRVEELRIHGRHPPSLSLCMGHAAGRIKSPAFA